MRVLLDERTAATGHHGIARATSELARALPRALPPDWDLVSLRLLEDEPAADDPGIRSTRIRPYSLREQLELPAIVHRESPDLFHSPTYWTAFRIQSLTVLTVYDLIPLHFSTGNFKNRVVYPWGIRRLLRRARGLVTATRATAELLRSHFDLGPARVEVCPLGCDHIERSHAVRPDIPGLEPQGFIYAVGNPRPHKNLATALEAYRRYREQSSSPRRFVLVGGSPRDHDAESGIWVRSSLSDGELRWIRENAWGAVFPSRMEGFDLPFLEALASGQATLATDIPPHREIAGPDYPLVPAGTEPLASGLLAWERDTSLRSELAARARSIAAPFTWDRHGLGVVRLWRELLEG